MDSRIDNYITSALLSHLDDNSKKISFKTNHIYKIWILRTVYESCISGISFDTFTNYIDTCIKI